MVNMRAGLPRLGTVCDEYRLGGLEHVSSGRSSFQVLLVVTWRDRYDAAYVWVPLNRRGPLRLAQPLRVSARTGRCPMSQQRRWADAGCLDDRHRVAGQFVMAEVRARTAGVPVSAPVRPDDPMPGSQALREQGEEIPAAVAPPGQEDHRVIGPGSLVVAGDAHTPGIGVFLLSLLPHRERAPSPQPRPPPRCGAGQTAAFQPAGIPRSARATRWPCHSHRRSARANPDRLVTGLTLPAG